MIFSIAMGAEYLFYVKSIATFAPTFYGYIISDLASVKDVVLNTTSSFFSRLLTWEVQRRICFMNGKNMVLRRDSIGFDLIQHF